MLPAASARSLPNYWFNSPDRAANSATGAVDATGRKTMTKTLNSYIRDAWFEPAEGLVDIPSAIDGHLVARTSTSGIDHKERLYALAFDTGATRKDNWVDIDGGVGTLFAYASRGRKELPSERFVVDGDVEQLSKGGTFVGIHILTPMAGVAVHINAYNF